MSNAVATESNSARKKNIFVRAAKFVANRVVRAARAAKRAALKAANAVKALGRKAIHAVKSVSPKATVVTKAVTQKVVNTVKSIAFRIYSSVRNIKRAIVNKFDGIRFSLTGTVSTKTDIGWAKSRNQGLLPRFARFVSSAWSDTLQPVVHGLFYAGVAAAIIVAPIPAIAVLIPTAVAYVYLPELIETYSYLIPEQVMTALENGAYKVWSVLRGIAYVGGTVSLAINLVTDPALAILLVLTTFVARVDRRVTAPSAVVTVTVAQVIDANEMASEAKVIDIRSAAALQIKDEPIADVRTNCSGNSEYCTAGDATERFNFVGPDRIYAGLCKNCCDALYNELIFEKARAEGLSSEDAIRAVNQSINPDTIVDATLGASLDDPETLYWAETDFKQVANGIIAPGKWLALLNGVEVGSVAKSGKGYKITVDAQEVDTSFINLDDAQGVIELEVGRRLEREGAELESNETATYPVKSPTKSGLNKQEA